VGTLRHTRYQAAVVRDGTILLVQCAFRNGGTVWILPGGGREEGEDEAACVAREVLEETQLAVHVDELLSDVAAEPPDGTYVRWRTYHCTVLGGEAAPGGGEGDDAKLVGVTWLAAHDEQSWPDEIRGDVFLYPQLQAIRHALIDREAERPPYVL
jgi:8-oxo-dGTP diphosphatase